jgi:hypothetical protein
MFTPPVGDPDPLPDTETVQERVAPVVIVPGEHEMDVLDE